MGLWGLAYAYFGVLRGDWGWGGRVLERVAFGWNVMGAWGIGVGMGAVWLPAWVVAAVLSWTMPPGGGGKGQG